MGIFVECGRELYLFKRVLGACASSVFVESEKRENVKMERKPWDLLRCSIGIHRMCKLGYCLRDI